MSIHPARVIASLSLLAGGFVVGVSVLAIAFVKALVAAGMTVRATDAALLDDLVPVLPFIAGFATLSVVAGVALLVGRARSEALAIGTAVVAVAAGVFGLVLIVVGRDPFASTSNANTTADGIGIVGTFTLIYLAVIVALGAARTRSTRSSASAAAS
jgi:hypothetical protein